MRLLRGEDFSLWGRRFWREDDLGERREKRKEQIEESKQIIQKRGQNEGNEMVIERK